jgi:DNA-3-methyladenine glycosylase
VLDVAHDLLGKFLVRQLSDGREIVSMITEVEAYDGVDDLACHAAKGRTPRTEVMFGSAGIWYVYFVYGMHNMLNIVTGPKEYPAAVLIRGTQDVSGPGRLTKHFQIDRFFNTKIASKESSLWIEDRGIKIKQSEIARTPRIGVDYAGPVWSQKEWRFILGSR